MWMIILMSDVWYAKDYVTESTLRYCMKEVFEHVNNGTVVCITDDLDTWCNEMNIDRENVVTAED